MEIEQYALFSYMPLEIVDYIVNQNNLITINSFSRTNKFNYKQYNCDKTLLKNNTICSQLSSTQHTLCLTKCAQTTDVVMAQRIIDTENKQNKDVRQNILSYFNYKKATENDLNCLECCMFAYKGITAGYDRINDYECLHATYSNNYEVLLILIKNNAPINIVDCFGKTSLSIATIFNNVSIVKLLLKNNCLESIQDHNGYTALHHACSTGVDRDIEQLLLCNKQNLNTRTRQGWTPLHIAIKRKNFELAKNLIAHGANINIKNKLGKKALELTNKKQQKALLTHLPSNKKTKTMK